MANVVVVGSQWGDEGKGKIVDWLSEQADIVVRFQGGHNAGHTLVIDGETYKLSLLPSGVVRGGKLSVIGNGVVIDLHALLDEIAQLKKQGVEVTPDNLRIAENAPLILPLHQELDAFRESSNAKHAHRHHQARHRPCLRGQGRPPRHPLHGSRRSAVARAEDRAAAGASQRAAPRQRSPRNQGEDHLRRSRSAGAESAALHGHGLGAARRQAARRQTHSVRRRARRPARHRPRHLPLRHLVQHRGGAGGDRLRRRPLGHRFRARHLQGLHHARRRRTVPHRPDGTTPSAKNSASAAANSAPSPAGRAAAAGSTRCWCGRPCAPPASTGWR